MIANVKSQKVARGYITLKNDLIPAGGVTDVQETGIELSCPEKRHTVIRDLFSRHVVRGNATLLQCSAPVFYALALARLNVLASEVVFLDDLGMNLKPAREMGMATIKVVDPDTALDALEVLLGFPLR